MRKFGSLTVGLLLICSSAFAQQKRELTIFISDISYLSNTFSKTHWYGGVGLAYSTFFTPHVSGEIAAAVEEHRSHTNIGVTPVTLRTYPIDLSARYHFFTESRWKPYLGLGVRHVDAPHGDPGFRYFNHVNPQIVGGVEYLVKPSIGITLDGKQIVGERATYDPWLKVSLGLNWRF